MDPQLAIDAGRDAIRTCLMVGGPILLLTLVAGLLISVLQAMTQLHDQSLSFVPKILLLMVAIAMCLPWLSDRMLDFARQSFARPDMIGLVGAGSSGYVPPIPMAPALEQSAARVAQHSTWGDRESTWSKSTRAKIVEQEQDRVEPDPTQAESPPAVPSKSPFLLPSYRYVPKEREDLEG